METSRVETDDKDPAEKWLVFQLAESEYGIPIRQVVEITEWPAVTPVPQAPPYLRGVAALRGRLVPVVDLRVKFGLPRGILTRESCLVTVELNGPEGKLRTGFLVDRVQDVVSLRESEWKPMPILDSTLQLDFLRGLAQGPVGVLVLLDAEKTVAGSDLSGLGALQQALRST